MTTIVALKVAAIWCSENLLRPASWNGAGLSRSASQSKWHLMLFAWRSEAQCVWHRKRMDARVVSALHKLLNYKCQPLLLPPRVFFFHSKWDMMLQQTIFFFWLLLISRFIRFWAQVVQVSGGLFFSIKEAHSVFAWLFNPISSKRRRKAVALRSN